jgi:hypothetical protein
MPPPLPLPPSLPSATPPLEPAAEIPCGSQGRWRRGGALLPRVQAGAAASTVREGSSWRRQRGWPDPAPASADLVSPRPDPPTGVAATASSGSRARARRRRVCASVGDKAWHAGARRGGRMSGGPHGMRSCVVLDEVDARLRREARRERQCGWRPGGNNTLAAGVAGSSGGRTGFIPVEVERQRRLAVVQRAGAEEVREGRVRRALHGQRGRTGGGMVLLLGVACAWPRWRRHGGATGNSRHGRASGAMVTRLAALGNQLRSLASAGRASGASTVACAEHV